jgi:hypothetical protein
MFVEICKLHDNKSKAIQELKNNLNVLQTNHRIMQLSDVDISQSTKSTIRHLVDGEIDGINKVELDKLFVEDKLQNVMLNWDVWVQKNFTTINSIRNKYAG